MTDLSYEELEEIHEKVKLFEGGLGDLPLSLVCKPPKATWFDIREAINELEIDIESLPGYVKGADKDES